MKMPQKDAAKSEARSSLDIEWERIKILIPNVEKGSHQVEDIERDIYSLINGKRTCDEIVEQQDLSRDSAVLIFLRLERDGIIHCFELGEKLRDVKFEKSEAEKELQFISLEKEKLQERITALQGEILADSTRSKDCRGEREDLEEKIDQIDKNIQNLEEQHTSAINKTDQLLSSKIDMVDRKKEAIKTAKLLKEEVLYLKDEKWSAMKSIRELESKIEDIVQLKEAYAPKISAYRSVVREAYKTLRDARSRAEKAMKGI